jgi:hypothetical protein
MPFEISWLSQGIITHWTGIAHSREVVKFIENIQSNPKFDDLKFSIHDYLRCEKIVFDENDMDYVGALDKAGAETNPNIKVAIIAKHPEVIAMVRGYKRLELTPYETEIFDDLNHVVNWLGSLGLSIET